MSEVDLAHALRCPAPQKLIGQAIPNWDTHFSLHL